jgi:hypothetical protein
MIDRLKCFLFGHMPHYFDCLHIKDSLGSPLIKLGTCIRCKAVVWESDLP